jgi:primosomal replication protein N
METESMGNGKTRENKNSKKRQNQLLMSCQINGLTFLHSQTNGKMVEIEGFICAQK